MEGTRQLILCINPSHQFFERALRGSAGNPEEKSG